MKIKIFHKQICTYDSKAAGYDERHGYLYDIRTDS